MTVTRPAARPLTRADLDAMPDDGYRRELIDGVLIVSPSPRTRHQQVLRGLFRQLDDACPAGLEILWAPFDVALADDTVLIPDLLVTRSEDLAERDLPVPPLLAVEVLSPSTRHLDLGTKKAPYEAAGTSCYWVVDPVELTVTAWELVDGVFVQAYVVGGDESWQAQLPFPVRITPALLLDS